jgi:flagellar protein FliO/FliZ
MRFFLLIVCWIHTTWAEAAQTNSFGEISHTEFLRVVGGLLIVVLVILVLAWLLRRLNVAHLTHSSGLKSLGSLFLGPKERVMLIQVGDRYLLIGVAAGSVTLLHDFKEQLPAGFDKKDKTPFSQILQSLMRKKKDE